MKRLLTACASVLLLTASAGADSLQRCTSDGVTPPKASNLHVVASERYPLLSKALHEEGATILDMVIDTDGRVSEASVAESSGSMRLDDAAVDDVRELWRYVPAQKDGKPFRCTWKAKVVWSLKRRNGKPSLVGMSANGESVESLMSLPIDKLFSHLAKSEFTITPPAGAYPAAALMQRIEGDVLVTVYAVPGIKMFVARVLASGDLAALADASKKLALENAKIGECSVNGKPAVCQLAIRVHWQLPDKRGG